MWIIKSIKFRKVLNSHVRFTNEFVIEFTDGSIGTGASPQGETISIYEDKKITVEPQTIIENLKTAGYFGKPLNQESFDRYLQQCIPLFGRNNAYGLSLAFFNATKCSQSIFELFGKTPAQLTAPHICFNILNGGWHAYTNPVLSDFSEFMLVAKTNDVEEAIGNHNEIQRLVKERLLTTTKTVVSGNPVNCFTTRDNRECIEFLLNVVELLGLSNQFDLMIDASAGDLWTGERYKFSITDGVERTSDELCEYWQDLIDQYRMGVLEDPLREKDFAGWQRLTAAQQNCLIIGDNLYSSDTERIKEGAAKKYAHGVVIKPNQAGTVTAVRQALETAQSLGHVVITSHRSISTESIFLSTLTCMYGVKYIKIGPLETDYSSVVRLNEIIRLTEQRG